MEIKGKQRIFRREYNGRVYYSTGISKKDMNTNTYNSEYMPVSFKKGVDIPDKTDIIINNAFLTFDKYQKEGETKPTVIWKIFVLDYTMENKEAEVAEIDNFSNIISESDDLPF